MPFDARVEPCNESVTALHLAAKALAHACHTPARLVPGDLSSAGRNATWDAESEGLPAYGVAMLRKWLTEYGRHSPSVAVCASTECMLKHKP